MAIILKECCLCYGKGEVKNVFGLGLDPKGFWVECSCGLRTPICNTVDQAIKLWNYINRETINESNKLQLKKDWLSSMQEQQAKDEIIKKSKIDKIVNLNKTNKLDKPKRHRRTKAEMEEARRILANNSLKKDDAIPKRKRRVK